MDGGAIYAETLLEREREGKREIACELSFWGFFSEGSKRKSPGGCGCRQSRPPVRSMQTTWDDRDTSGLFVEVATLGLGSADLMYQYQ